MKKHLLNIFVLFSFVLSNSNLFFYQHYCGDKLFGTALFHTISCECGDNMNIDEHQSWIISKDDGCCKETLIFAHTKDDFYTMQYILKIFFSVLSVLGVAYTLFHTSFLSDTLNYFQNHFRRRYVFLPYLLFHYKTIRTVVLRN